MHTAHLWLGFAEAHGSILSYALLCYEADDKPHIWKNWFCLREPVFGKYLSEFSGVFFDFFPILSRVFFWILQPEFFRFVVYFSEFIIFLDFQSIFPDFEYFLVFFSGFWEFFTKVFSGIPEYFFGFLVFFWIFEPKLN